MAETAFAKRIETLARYLFCGNREDGYSENENQRWDEQTATERKRWVTKAEGVVFVWEGSKRPNAVDEAHHLLAAMTEAKRTAPFGDFVSNPNIKGM